MILPFLEGIGAVWKTERSFSRLRRSRFKGFCWRPCFRVP